MPDPSYGRIRNTAAALLAVVALGAVAVGCGGGSSESESALRGRLEASGEKLAAAESFNASVLYEVEEESESEVLGCINIGIDNGKPARFDMLVFDLSCEGGTEGHEVIAIGNRAWASSEPGRYAAAKVSPKLRKQVDGEQTDNLKQLFAAAEDVDTVAEGSAVMEPSGKFVDVPTYFFRAPASAFPVSADAGDAEVEFEATIDRRGFLRELVVHADEDGTGATVKTTYEDIDSDLGIKPPDPSEVHGPVVQINSSEDLDELLGTPSA